MLGPSGFFLPAGAGNTDNDSNDLELIHSSEEGFNELYRICKNGRFFVYKSLKAEFRGNNLYEDLLDKDFNIGFSLNHSGICQYYAKISHPVIGRCIVMEWIDGCTLESLISKGKIEGKLAKKIICEICDALDYMHRKQVIHRDLKPENIIITHNGLNVKIIDFGLSDTDSYGALKVPAGTRIYASPELIAGDHVDNRSDIWSLGVIINEISGRYRLVASRCLHRDKKKRYGSAEEVRKGILKEPARKARLAVMWAVIITAGAFAFSMLFEERLPAEDMMQIPETVAVPDAADSGQRKDSLKGENLWNFAKLPVPLALENIILCWMRCMHPCRLPQSLPAIWR